MIDQRFPSDRALSHAAMLVYATLGCDDAILKVPMDATVGTDDHVTDTRHPLLAYMLPDDVWNILNAGYVVSPNPTDALLADERMSREEYLFHYLSRSDAALWIVRRMPLVVALATMIEAGEVTSVEQAYVEIRSRVPKQP